MPYDLIVAGGGLAGSALARAMASRGARVLVIERETRFRDRVRGEGLHPWGGAEARALDLYDLLLDGGGHEVRWWRSSLVGMSPPQCRDLHATTPHRVGELDFYHPRMQEVLLRAAEAAGVEVRRGVSVTHVAPGKRPAVTLRSHGNAAETLHARVVVGADGRQSRVRRWGGFPVQQDPEQLVIGGVLLAGLHLPDDAVQVVRHPSIGQAVLIFPLGEGWHRVYFVYRKRGQPRRRSGRRHVPDFIEACIETGACADWFDGAEEAGPLAMFEGADTWVEHPYRQGVALIGDAAAASDPSWGCGMSLALRDARVLRDFLLTETDWETAGHSYAVERDRYYGSLHRITRWLADLFYEVGPDADARRSRVLPRLAREPERAPDTAGLGPDGPNDEANLLRLG